MENHDTTLNDTQSYGDELLILRNVWRVLLDDDKFNSDIIRV